MYTQTGSIDLAAAHAAGTLANGKNTIYHQASEPTGGTYKEGDTWFDTDDDYAMYTYNGSAWVKEQFSSGAISSLDAGKITTGELTTILIKSANDDYWNLGSVDVTAGGTTYAANTLQTNHLVAQNDITVIGDSTSVIHIPTNDDDSAYTELSQGGLKNVSVNWAKTGTYTTTFPSTDLDGDGVIFSSVGEDDFANREAEMNLDKLRISRVADGYTWESEYGYGAMKARRGTNFVVNIDTYNQSMQFGSGIIPVDFYLNGTNIAKIADSYPTQSGHQGACTVWTGESGVAQYVSFAVNISSKVLYVYASNDPANIAYVGRVALT